MNEGEITATAANSGSGYVQGDVLTFRVWRPWWQRLWRWITRKKEPVFIVTGVTSTTMTVSRPPE